MTTSITLSSQEKSPSPLRKTPWTETKLAQQVAAVAYDTLSAIRNSATAAKHWSYQAAKSAKLDTALGIGLSMGGGLLFVSGGMLVIDNMYDIKKHYRLKNWEGVSSKALLTAPAWMEASFSKAPNCAFAAARNASTFALLAA